MTNKRRVGFSVLFNLLKGKKPYGIVGLVLIIISFLFMLFILPFSLVFNGINSDYNFSAIKKHGTEKNAKIIHIKTVYNISVNEVHPIIISYKYNDNGNMKTDKFETLNSDEVTGLGVDSTVKVLVYNHQSVVKGMEPLLFPNWLFIIPVIPFIAGAALFLIGLIPALKIYNLYKTGIIKEAIITSVGINQNTPALLSTKIPVSYYFLDDQQNQVSGESESTDVIFWMQKKIGDSIKILVSKSDETQTCIVPLTLAAKYNWIV